MSMHMLSGLSGAALGLLAGPLVGRLASGAPGDVRPVGRRRRAVITAAAAVVLALLAAALGPQPALPAYLWLGLAGVALAVIDLEHHRLPDVLTLPTYGVGLVLFGVAAAVDGDGARYLRALLAMTAVFAAFFVLAFLGGVGFGDTKLAGVLGLYLGWIGWGTVLLGLAAGFVVGAAVAVVLLLRRLAGWRTDFAFGPALLLGALVAVVSGGPLVDAYVSGGAG